MSTAKHFASYVTSASIISFFYSLIFLFFTLIPSSISLSSFFFHCHSLLPTSLTSYASFSSLPLPPSLPMPFFPSFLPDLPLSFLSSFLTFLSSFFHSYNNPFILISAYPSPRILNNLIQFISSLCRRSRRRWTDRSGTSDSK